MFKTSSCIRLSFFFFCLYFSFWLKTDFYFLSIICSFCRFFNFFLYRSKNGFSFFFKKFLRSSLVVFRLIKESKMLPISFCSLRDVIVVVFQFSFLFLLHFLLFCISKFYSQVIFVFRSTVFLLSIFLLLKWSYIGSETCVVLFVYLLSSF